MTETIGDKRVSRRQFVGTAAAGAATLGVVAGTAALVPGAGATPVADAKSGTSLSLVAKTRTAVRGQPIPVPVNWSISADVVVVGTGIAGLSAAVTANDAGANVLILEKLSQALEGGSSKVSGNQVFAPTFPTSLAPDVVDGAIYLMANASGTVEDKRIFSAQAQGYYDNLAMIEALGGNLGTSSGGSSYPTAPGASCYHTFAIAPAGATVQSNGYPLGSTGDGGLWKVFRAAAASRNINVMYQTPATDLIQDPTSGEILGVRALANASEIVNIQAKRAVVLACGSIEFAADLQKQYYPMSPVYSTGCPGNTGDGVRMAQKVGADLWHMNAIFPSYGAFVIPGTDPTVVGVAPVGVRGIAVNKQGNRFNMGTAVNGPVGGFANETNVSFTYDTTTFDWDSVPCWAIMDSSALGKGPIMATTTVPSPAPGVGGTSSWFVDHSGLTWSKDNSAEVAKGWILSANDLNTLAAAIAADPDNGGRMTGAQLQATITAYNLDCTNKADAQFLTSASLLTPINGPPFYAMKVWPNSTNAAAGPRRNIECQVVDPSKQPIPRLYSAGELGAFWGWLNSSGTHLAEGIWTGRVAGNNAAMEIPWA